MSLTKSDFGQMLVEKLETTTDIIALSRWAYQTYLDNSRRLESGLKEILLDIGRMEDSPEFEYTAKELLDMARGMIESDD